MSKIKDLPRRLQIPIGCALNVLIIGELKRTDIFKEKCIEVPLKIGATPPVKGEEWPFFNLSWGSYMMYCLIVVPKEIFDLSKEDEFYQFENKDILQSFEFKKRNEKSSFDQDPKHHLRKLRNAISHVHYEIDDNDILTLWDTYPNSGKINWEVRIGHSEMLTFLEEMAKKFLLLYKQIKKGERNSDGTKT